jgi:hypothetical protein
MALDCITSLYQTLIQQEKLVEDHEDSVLFLLEANVFVDVEQLTGVTMQEEIEQLDDVRGILADLYARLGWAINEWGDAAWAQLTMSTTSSSGMDQGQTEQSPSPELVVDEQAASVSRNNNAPHLDDPNVGTQSRHAQQWENWTAAPTIDNPSKTDLSQPTAPWWMQDNDHYGLCQPHEQAQLETSARAAHSSRAHAPAPAPPQYRSFAREVRQAQHRRFVSSALPVPPAPGVYLSYSRPARSCSDDFWLDEEYQPEFWQKNLRPGDIWTGAPARYPLPEDDDLSPRSVSVPRGGWQQVAPPPTTTTASGLYPGEKLQVGDTNPASYFPGARKSNLRNLMTRCA